MKCSNCGKEFNEPVNFCTSCGTKFETEGIIDDQKPNNSEEIATAVTPTNQTTIIDNNIENQSQTVDEITKENEKANLLCIISVCIYFFGSAIGVFISNLIPILGGFTWLLSPLTAIGIMIYVRIKYPKNLFGKILMIIYIVLTILAIIGLIILIIMCQQLARSCSSLG